MDTAAYLARIGISRPTHPDLQSLTALHLAHLMAVRFIVTENGARSERDLSEDLYAAALLEHFGIELAA